MGKVLAEAVVKGAAKAVAEDAVAASV